MNRALGLRRPRRLPVGKRGAESPRVDEPSGAAAEIRVEITAGEFQQCHYHAVTRVEAQRRFVGSLCASARRARQRQRAC
jgi:hypothetical protein